MYSTLFSQIAALVTIDVDSMDPEDATQHTNSLFKFCDMTSNQAIVQGQVARVDRADILEGALKSVKSKAGDLISKEDIVEDVLDLLVGFDLAMTDYTWNYHVKEVITDGVIR